MSKKQDIAKRVVAGGLALIIIFGTVTSFAIDSKALIEKGKSKSYVELDKTRRKTDNIIDLSYIKTYKKDETTMIPLREVLEDQLGIGVKWIEETNVIEINNGPQWTSIKTGENSYFHGKIAPFKLSHAPEVKKGKTYVPEDFFEKVLFIEVYKPTHGVIKEVINKGNVSLHIVEDKDYSDSKEIILDIIEGSTISDELGNPVPLDYLKRGTKVSFDVPKMLTMNIPPRGNASKIIIKNKVELPQEFDNLDKINNRIRGFVAIYKENDIYDNVKLKREVSFLEDNILGISFKGSYEVKGNTKEINRDISFNMETGEEITFETFFKRDKESQEKLKEILDEKAREKGYKEFQAEGRWISFKDDNAIVTYYALDDSIQEINLSIPLKEVKNLME